MTLTAAPPARPPRPTAVTTASWMQLAAAALLLVAAGLLVWHAIWWDGEIDHAARLVPDADPAEVDGERFGNVMMSCVLGVPVLLFAALLGVAARGVRRGSNGARIAVFVAGGLQLLVGVGQGCCAGAALPFFFAFGAPMEAGDVPPEFLPEESTFSQTLYGTDPQGDLFFAGGGLIALLVLGLTVTAVVLLALPTSHRWFVPQAAEPPRLPAGYPAPSAFLLPPGYMICPDPRAHGVPGQYGPAAPGPAAPAAPIDPAAAPDGPPTDPTQGVSDAG
ncbi:hypothetical protein ONA91_04300 [Micromonospora sp. DR5-3]|uniref:hypothetical protein n=1 Tax=unclassified Micromonospora TaxID=2617518 RepID=UPI0016520774|nr:MULTISPECIES: hypothetical protein [unclassified Micromonospora]MCW3813679.1 hypothetical protein [Micromonospora sp. DR5-3]